jgi:hypothetical protein
MEKGNYSVDMMKKQAFVHELNNYLNIIKCEPVITDEDVEEYIKIKNVIEYLENRIKEFDKRNK